MNDTEGGLKPTLQSFAKESEIVSEGGVNPTARETFHGSSEHRRHPKPGGERGVVGSTWPVDPLDIGVEGHPPEDGNLVEEFDHRFRAGETFSALEFTDLGVGDADTDDIVGTRREWGGKCQAAAKVPTHRGAIGLAPPALREY